MWLQVLNSVDPQARKGFMPLKDCAAFHQRSVAEQDSTETLERVLATMERTEQQVERLAAMLASLQVAGVASAGGLPGSPSMGSIGNPLPRQSTLNDIPM